jgi:cyclopropane fatty-acyl-phospholipid synthase-like methyltransferase
VFEQWESRVGRKPRILALAVGLGAAEGVWLERGYDVTVHECQETSLRALREQFPQAPVIIADLRGIVIPGRFDIITMLASEYMLSNQELASFLRTAKASIAEDGSLVLHSVTILSIVRLAKECLKRLGRRQSGHVFWGWLRTPSELTRGARDAGFRVDSAYRVGVNGSNTVLRKRWRLLGTRPTLHDESMLLVLGAPRAKPPRVE